MSDFHARPWAWSGPAALLIVAVFVCGCSGGSATPAPAKNEASVPAGTAETVRTPAKRSGATRELPDFAALVEEYGDTVVNVGVVGRPRLAADSPSTSADDPLLDFFRRFGIPAPGSGGEPGGGAPVLRGAGSGFIVSPDGYILTNAHVVSQADEVTVRLRDRREFPAKVVGSDRRTDVAVIKIDAKDLPTVRIGDHNKLRTGDWVLAIGSPFGLDNTATAGIVSATSRAVGGETDVPFIQTDVAVNPGNSGGPLFNLDGEVVGINSMIFSQTGGYMGISFAIPIEVAMNVREQLVKTGRVVRGRIGVVVQDLDAGLASSFGLERPQGALVSDVESGGPAQKAGLRPGDVVLRVNGQPVERIPDLSGAISRQPPGEEATLTIWRGRRQQDVKVRVAEVKEPETRVAGEQAPNRSEEGARFGLLVRPLAPEEKRATKTEGNVVVARVGGPAARAGVQPGDIVLAVNDKPIRSVKELRESASRLEEGEAVALLIEREGVRSFVSVRAGG
jgi:serine protease Do